MNGVMAATARAEPAAHQSTGDLRAPFGASSGSMAPYTGTNSTRLRLSSIDSINPSAYQIHPRGVPRRTVATINTVSQTAAAATKAYDRASMPAHVVRGRIANMAPAQSAVGRFENCLVNTTTPAAAAPTARELGKRDQNSVGGKRANQPCISR